jgi:hypothetical protein
VVSPANEERKAINEAIRSELIAKRFVGRLNALETTQMRYAKQTSVSSEKSRAEIEQTVHRYGADQFAFGEAEGRAMIGFRLTKPRKLTVRFLLPLYYEREHEGRRQIHNLDPVRDAQQIRQRWTALLLVIKAKLEAVETNIETIEQAFMAETVMPDGKTVAEHLLPQINKMLESGVQQTLLLEFGQ